MVDYCESTRTHLSTMEIGKESYPDRLISIIKTQDKRVTVLKIKEKLLDKQSNRKRIKSPAKGVQRVIIFLENSILRDSTFCDAHTKNSSCKLNEPIENENILHVLSTLRHVFLNISLSETILESA